MGNSYFSVCQSVVSGVSGSLAGVLGPVSSAVCNAGSFLNVEPQKLMGALQKLSGAQPYPSQEVAGISSQGSSISNMGGIIPGGRTV